MLEFLYRKIVNNIWLFLCLLIGALSACGVLSSIPLYSNAVLQKVLTRDLENYHVENRISPGAFSFELAGSREYSMEYVAELYDIAENYLVASYKLPSVDEFYRVRTTPLDVRREGDDFFNKQRVRGCPVYVKGYEDKIELLYGRLPEGNTPDGVYEVAVSLEGMNAMQLLLDQEYTLEWSDFFQDKHAQVAKVKVVGIFTVKDTNSLFWSRGRYRMMEDALIISEDQMNSLLELEQISISNVERTWYLDYRMLKIGDVDRVVEVFEEQTRWNDKNGKIAKIFLPILNVLESYKERRIQLRITLWILTTPMMLIICFYTIIISSLIVKNSRNEIAVLKSRGAGRLQVFLLYMVESLILAFISLISGPGIGYYICRILGASNGFLEFVNRSTLIPVISPEVYGYSAVAALIFMAFMMVPVIKASTTGIVEYKRSLVTGDGKAFWQKFYLDVLVLALCGYGYYNFKNRQNILSLTGIGGTDIGVDPLLFFISTFFILGVSLLFLRLYPLIVRFIFKLGIRWWNPVTYFSLVNVSRADRNQQSIMLFIILSLSFGIVSANQARTINSNVYDKVMYKNGADVVIEPYNNLKHAQDFADADFIESVYSSSSGAPKEYREPPYEQYRKINGYESITKVITDNKAQLIGGRESIKSLRLMGVAPHEFGQTAWFRSDLLSYHINEYLNLLTKAPTAIFLSSSIRDDFTLREGDNVFIRLSNGESLEFTIYGFIDYFPSCNPYIEGTDGKVKKSYFAVVNQSYIMRKLMPVPYEIWIKKQPGVSDGDINEQLEALSLTVERVDYASQELIKKKNDPILLGTNGVLTMCFIVTMFIAAIGFVLFWVLSIREKSLKFGIFRAMGMPMRSVTLIMLLEQLLVSVTSIIAGILLGTVAGMLFIPLLEMVYSVYQQVPPFRIIADQGDYIKVLGMGGIMLLTGLTVLYGLVRSINIHQVLKMGEDS